MPGTPITPQDWYESLSGLQKAAALDLVDLDFPKSVATLIGIGDGEPFGGYLTHVSGNIVRFEDGLSKFIKAKV